MSLGTFDQMAKRNPPVPPTKVEKPVVQDPKNRKPMIVQLRGSEAFKEWTEEVAEIDRSTLAVLVEKALIQYAQGIGMKKPAPRR